MKTGTFINGLIPSFLKRVGGMGKPNGILGSKGMETPRRFPNLEIYDDYKDYDDYEYFANE